ncbi:Circadian-associated transcriptional repressor [Merluccius polli]|uniref:Circadian-associated transcriptional repressor n=1 Tax=Merluccius polli TaxID=89951 RepID=A0AA47NX19_MERPO|nr:Circadian-associated transcriptional repressor [Merluccius polli]
MSTSDSDYSIDWLASDEEDSDSFISPQHRGTQPPPSSAATAATSLTDYPRSPSGTTTTTTTTTTSTTTTTTTPSSNNTTDCTLKDAHPDRSKGKSGDRAGSVCRGGAADTWRAQGCAGVGRDDDTAPWPFWTTAAPLGAATGRPRQAPKRAHSPDRGGHRETPECRDTENVLFSHKCVGLQRYVQPLASILRGLSSGRYSQRLSSFQESVAMDRIQRILGVLQNPNMGERFLSTLLQIEKMLQSWFPHVKPRPTVIQSQHSTPAKRQKRHHTSATPPLISAPSLSTDPASSGPYSATSLKWLHASPICSPKTAGQGQPTATATTPSGCDLGATQDNAVSSSTDGAHGGRSRRARQAPPPSAATPFKLRAPCLERLLQAKDSVVSRRTAQEEGGVSGGEASCKLPDSKHVQRQRSL